LKELNRRKLLAEISQEYFFVFFHEAGPFIRLASFIFNSIAYSAAEQVISQYQTSDNKKDRYDSRRDKKQNCHARSKAEQHKSAYSSHIIPQSIHAI